MQTHISVCCTAPLLRVVTTSGHFILDKVRLCITGLAITMELRETPVGKLISCRIFVAYNKGSTLSIRFRQVFC